MGKVRAYDNFMKLKEPLNGLLHLIGAVLAIPAMIVLIFLGRDSAWKIVSFAVYGSTLFLLYLFSTLYHWLPASAGGKHQVFRKFDHLSIYLLIAGTYTPFCLILLRGPWGWTVFGIIWTFAVTFVILQSIFIDLPRWLTTAVYILMGWSIVIAIKPLVSMLELPGLMLLILGGVVYSTGGVIYTVKKPNLSKNFDYHALWHILVLLGSALIYLVMLIYLV